MTEVEHAQIVRDEAEGRLSLGIDRTVARKFFTETPLRSIQRTTGEAPYFEKLLAYVCFIGGPIALLVAGVLSVIYFGWWSIALVPVTVFAWVGFYGDSARAGSGLTGITSVLAVVLALHVFNPFSWRGTLFYVVVALSLWMSRCLYVASTIFLRALIVRSHRAFAMLSDTIVLKRL